MALLTVKQFRTELQASDPTIRRWIRRGVIPVYHVGHFIRIDREVALEALQTHKPRRRKARAADKGEE